MHVPVLVGKRGFIASPVEPVFRASQLERESQQRAPGIIHPVRVRVRVWKETVGVRAIVPGLFFSGQRAADSNHATIEAPA